MKFLVTRMDALIEKSRKNQINSSQMWPTIIIADDHEDAVRRVYDRDFGPSQQLPLNRQFLVVAMIDAEVVTFKPRQDYTVESNPYT